MKQNMRRDKARDLDETAPNKANNGRWMFHLSGRSDRVWDRVFNNNNNDNEWSQAWLFPWKKANKKRPIVQGLNIQKLLHCFYSDSLLFKPWTIIMDSLWFVR